MDCLPARSLLGAALPETLSHLIAWSARLTHCRFVTTPTVGDCTTVPQPRWLAPLHYPRWAARLILGVAAYPR